MLVAQHRWARAFQRRVTGSQIRLATARPAAPAIVLCSVTPSCRIASPTSAASTAVPTTANANRRVVGQAPLVRLGCPEPMSKAAVPTGAARIPASTSAASTDQPPPPPALTLPTTTRNVLITNNPAARSAADHTGCTRDPAVDDPR